MSWMEADIQHSLINCTSGFSNVFRWSQSNNCHQQSVDRLFQCVIVQAVFVFLNILLKLIAILSGRIRSRRSLISFDSMIVGRNIATVTFYSVQWGVSTSVWGFPSYIHVHSFHLVYHINQQFSLLMYSICYINVMSTFLMTFSFYIVF